MDDGGGGGWFSNLLALGSGTVLGSIVTKLIDYFGMRHRMQAESELLRAKAAQTLAGVPTPEEGLHKRTFEALSFLIESQQKLYEEQEKQRFQLVKKVEELSSEVHLLRAHIDELSIIIEKAGLSLPPLNRSNVI